MSATMADVEPSLCLAGIPIVGTRCDKKRIGGSSFCAKHRPLWHNKDSPDWGLRPATMVDFDPTICLAWVTETGLRCSKERYGVSRWCTEHFSEWHEEDSPGWRQCPS